MGDHTLDGLVVRYLASVQDHADRTLDDLCRERPELSAELRSRIAILRRLGLDLGAAQVDTVAEIAASIRQKLLTNRSPLGSVERERESPR